MKNLSDFEISGVQNQFSLVNKKLDKNAANYGGVIEWVDELLARIKSELTQHVD